MSGETSLKKWMLSLVCISTLIIIAKSGLFILEGEQIELE